MICNAFFVDNDISKWVFQGSNWWYTFWASQFINEVYII